MTNETKDELADALGKEEKPSLKAAKKAVKKPSKGEVSTGKKAKAKLEAAGDKKTKVKGVDDKPKAKAKPKTKAKKADGGNRGVRHGNHTAAIEQASKLISKLKKGTSFTTREVKEKWPEGPNGWAFREAAKRLVADKVVKLKNADRVNTITRL